MGSVSIWQTPCSLYWNFVLILGDLEIPIYPFTSRTNVEPIARHFFSTNIHHKVGVLDTIL